MVVQYVGRRRQVVVGVGRGGARLAAALVLLAGRRARAARRRRRARCRPHRPRRCTVAALLLATWCINYIFLNSFKFCIAIYNIFEFFFLSFSVIKTRKSILTVQIDFSKVRWHLLRGVLL